MSKNILLMSLLTASYCFAAEQKPQKLLIEQQQEQLQINDDTKLGAEYTEQVRQEIAAREERKKMQAELEAALEEAAKMAQAKLDQERLRYEEQLAQAAIEAIKKASANDNPAETTHVRICPVCKKKSSECYADSSRLKKGIIHKCGCKKCGGNGYSS